MRGVPVGFRNPRGISSDRKLIIAAKFVDAICPIVRGVALYLGKNCLKFCVETVRLDPCLEGHIATQVKLAWLFANREGVVGYNRHRTVAKIADQINQPHGITIKVPDRKFIRNIVSVSPGTIE